MSLMPMQKIAVFFPRSQRDNLLALLQDKGCVEILDLKETPLAEALQTTEATGGGDADRIAGDIRRAIEDVSEFEERRGFLSGLGGGKVVVDGRRFSNITEEFDYESIVTEVDQLEARRTELRTKRNHAEAFIDRLAPWSDLDVPLEALSPTEHTEIFAGTLSGTATPEALASALAEISETFALEVIGGGERETCVVVLCERSEDEQIREVLRKHDFEVQAFENLKGLPRDLIAEAEQGITSLERETEELVKKGEDLAAHKPRLMIAHDYFAEEARKTHARSFIGTTELVGVIEGWVRRDEYDRLAKDVEAKVEAAGVLKIEPEEKESPPIELKNRRIMKPFEVITEMYGMPHAREVDPTPLAAPFFALFFGFCITDAGYGIALVILSLLLMRHLKTGHKLLQLIMIGGIMTIVMGAITGGWFGIEFPEEITSPWMGLLVKLRQFEPLKDPMLMFMLALVLGFIQVTFGLVIEMIENLRSRDIMGAVFDQIAWIVLLWSVVLFGLGKTGRIPAEYVPSFKWAAIAAAVGIVGFTYRTSKNPGVRIAWGLYNLYGITGYVGDVLSYARLLALGLATGGIAMVINQMAVMVKGMPVVGYPAMIFVLVAGHTMNIAVNALGGFVHSARLQYVEFYPKFFEGGGRRFRPFKREPKYTRLAGTAS
jgi:V/A-type H+-transporting ATPase subunit I